MRTTGASRRTTARVRRRPARNRRRFSLRRLLRPLIGFVLLAGIVYGCYYALTTPKLRVTRVRVLGTRLLDQASLEADARSAACGKNILILSKKRIAARVGKNRPEIHSISIGRILPRTVVVRVTERVPYTAVANTTNMTAGGQKRSYWLVDKDGVSFHKVDEAPDSIPLIELSPEIRIDLSAGRKIRDARFTSAMKCIGDCHAAKCKVSKISVDRLGNLCLNMGSDFYVKLGQPVDIPKKLEKLSRILARPELIKKALYIDVSCKEAPVVKPKPGTDERPAQDT